MQFTPYLNFDGQCAEAFTFYAKVFGGQLVNQMTFADMPPGPDAPEIPADAKDRVMHVGLQVGDQMLMGSDTMPGACAAEGGYTAPSGMSVAIQLTDAKEGQRVFDALSAGGKVTMPYSPTFFSDGFGMLTDRFGTPWMVNVEKAA